MAQIDPNKIQDDQLHLDALAPPLFKSAGLIGLVGIVGSGVAGLMVGEGALKHLSFTYLVSYCFFLSISLGALFFVTLQHLTRAGWSVAVRRIAEIFAANTLLMAILFIPVLVSMGTLYHWTHADAVAHDPLLQGKAAYLNPTFFTVRSVIYFAIWIWLSRGFWKRSVRQDETGDTALTLRSESISAPGMLLFALTCSFAAFDFIMTLDPHWYSTIFGIYVFAGCMLGFMAALALTSMFLQSKGRLTNSIGIEHYHDIGKWMFGFVFFWGYIAFSQYMLIWYGNIPEETGWFLKRQSDVFLGLSLTLLFGHFLIPFLGLLSRHVKRQKAVLAFWAVWVLAAHYIDLYWLIMPEMNPEQFPFGLLDVGVFLGVGGLFVAAAALAARPHALIPLKDPRLHESLSFENY